MKAGLISAYGNSMWTVYELLLRSKQHETITYKMGDFNPSIVQRDNLGFLLLEGRSCRDDGYLIAIAKHVEVPILYPRPIKFFEPMNNDDKEELKQYFNVEIFDILDLDKEVGLHNLISRLGELK